MTNGNLTEKTLEESVIYRGKVITVRKDRVQLPDGQESFREKVCHSGGACIVAVNDGKILLVKQFRYAYGEVIYEIPAGKLEKGEDPKHTAIRELKEETGFIAGKTEFMYCIYPTPGYTDEKLYLYKAEALSKGEVNPDEDEFVEPIWIDLQTAYKMVENGEIKDAKTVIALLHLKAVQK